MKKTVLVFLAFCCSVHILSAQNTKPDLLLEPEGWEFERFGLPPTFAPAITYHGFEELRFSPGMFKKDSADYWSYIFVSAIDQIKDPGEEDLLNYVVGYYKGLCATVAKDNKLTIDTSRIKATINKSVSNSASGPGGPAGGIVFESIVELFGVFADAAPVTLNLEIQVFQDDAEKRTLLFFIASPQSKTSPIWKNLYGLREHTKLRNLLRNKIPGS